MSGFDIVPVRFDGLIRFSNTHKVGVTTEFYFRVRAECGKVFFGRDNFIKGNISVLVELNGISPGEI